MSERGFWCQIEKAVALEADVLLRDARIEGLLKLCEEVMPLP